MAASLPHDNLGPRLDAVNWSLTTLATAFLGLRIYCKLLRNNRLWWDDAILVVSWAFLVTSSCIDSVSVSISYGKHSYDIAPSAFAMLPLLSDVSGTFAILAAVWSKTSFAVTLLRITQGWTRLAVWLAILSMNVAMHLTAIMVWVQCTPVQKVWNPRVPGTCFSIDRLIEYNMFSAAYSAAMDILLALLPWKIVWAAKLRRSETFGVAVAMSMGIFAGIAAFVKVTQVLRMKSDDIYDGVELTMWSTAEIAITIMAASVPILRALLGDHQRRRRIRRLADEPQWLPKYRISWTDNLELQTRSTCVIESGGRNDGNITHKDGTQSRDSGDDVELLTPPLPVAGAIVRTSVVTVVFEEDPNREKDKMEAGRERERREIPIEDIRLPPLPTVAE